MKTENPTPEFRFRVEKGIRRYIAQRRALLDEFLVERFSFRGTFQVFSRTLRTDVIRHPINFLLAIPFLFVGRIANWLEKFGLSRPARILQRVALRIGTAFETRREVQLSYELLGLSDDRENALLSALTADTAIRDVMERSPGVQPVFRTPQIQDALAVAIRDLMATRAAVLDLVSSGLTVALAYVLFGKFVLSPYQMGKQLADLDARHQAASRFVLGRPLGSAFYRLFPPHPTTLQIVVWSAVIIFALGALTAVINVLSDPVQQRFGVHRRQLSRLLDACEDRLVLYAASNLVEIEIGELSLEPSLQQSAVFERVLSPPVRGRRSSTLSAVSSLHGRMVLLLKRPVQRMVDEIGRFEARFGRKGLLLSFGALLLITGSAGFVVYRQMDPYSEVRRLIDQKAFVTAVARLDKPGKKGSRSKDGEYWYWRGRALIGNKNVDSGIEAYRSAVAEGPNYRRDSVVIRDAIEAVASKNHERAKLFILEEIGPSAIEPLLARAKAEEDIHRWSLVELVKKLGGNEGIKYDQIARVDLAAAPSCQGKRRAIEKIVEYRVKAAIPALRELDEQQLKCLQGAVKPAIAKLEATR